MTCGPVCWLHACHRRSLKRAKFRPDRGDVLIELRDHCDATGGDPVQCGLPDMARQPERSRGQRRRGFCHI
jgi:hypothetical protein